MIGLTGDTVTSTHPVIDGVAIVDADAAPATPITFDWNRLPEVTGKVYAADGTCWPPATPEGVLWPVAAGSPHYIGAHDC
ncbi:MAG: hypothetical protein R2703_01805 [Micropruina glycogenica]